MTRWIINLGTLVAAALLIMSPAAFAGTGKLVFVRGGNVWIANTDGTEAQQLTLLEPSKYNNLGPALAPNGQWVAFSSYQKGSGKQLYLLSSSGGAVKPLLPKGIETAWSPSFSPDGKSLLFVGMSQHRMEKKDGDEFFCATMSISLMDLEKGLVRHIVSTPDTFLDAGSVYANPSFSPDGQMIAYQDSGSDVSGGFYVVNLQGKIVFEFPPKPQDATTPHWRPRFSPDAKEILYYSPRTSYGGGSVENQRDSIYLVNMATQQARRIAGGWNPTFVDGGKAIVYEVWPPELGQRGSKVKPDLWRLDLAPGSQPRKILTDGAEPAGQP